jgi:hypothetical protein
LIEADGAENFCGQADSGSLVWMVPNHRESIEIDALAIIVGSFRTEHANFALCMPCAFIEQLFGMPICVEAAEFPMAIALEDLSFEEEESRTNVEMQAGSDQQRREAKLDHTAATAPSSFSLFWGEGVVSSRFSPTLRSTPGSVLRKGGRRAPSGRLWCERVAG